MEGKMRTASGNFPNFITFLLFTFLLAVPVTAFADSVGWITHIESGKPFRVVFDKTLGKFDDTNYTGDWQTDPMGALKGGESYDVIYNKRIFSCTGFNQAVGKNGTWFYSNANPSNSHLSLWGRIYSFDGLGLVYDSQFGLVGHLIRR
jgi:hypothetical protein